MELIDQLIAAQEQRDACIAYAVKLTRQRDALLAALKAVEWIHRTDRSFCPWCHATRFYPLGANVPLQHTSDCQRQSAIAAVEGSNGL